MIKVPVLYLDQKGISLDHEYLMEVGGRHAHEIQGAKVENKEGLLHVQGFWVQKKYFSTWIQDKTVLANSELGRELVEKGLETKKIHHGILWWRKEIEVVCDG